MGKSGATRDEAGERRSSEGPRLLRDHNGVRGESGGGLDGAVRVRGRGLPEMGT